MIEPASPSLLGRQDLAGMAAVNIAKERRGPDYPAPFFSLMTLAPRGSWNSDAGGVAE
jgi:hypothetical protein